jgi:hypothetical protein
VAGVHFLVSSAQPLGFWQAKLKLAGQRVRYKSFSVLRYGKRRAYEMAVQAREAMLAQADDTPYLYSQVAMRGLKKGVSAAGAAAAD